MKRSFLVLSLVFNCFLSFGQPGTGEDDPCADADTAPPECYIAPEDPNGPIDKGVPFLLAAVVFFAVRKLKSP